MLPQSTLGRSILIAAVLPLFPGLRVAKAINCTGPRTEYSKYQHPLLINLLAAGLIGHDSLALGIDAQPTGEVAGEDLPLYRLRRSRRSPAAWSVSGFFAKLSRMYRFSPGAKKLDPGTGATPISRVIQCENSMSLDQPSGEMSTMTK